jgi:hypothetical protein
VQRHLQTCTDSCCEPQTLLKLSPNVLSKLTNIWAPLETLEATRCYDNWYTSFLYQKFLLLKGNNNT